MTKTINPDHEAFKSIYKEIAARFPKDFNAGFINNHLNIGHLPDPAVVIVDLEIISKGMDLNKIYIDENSKANALDLMNRLNQLRMKYGDLKGRIENNKSNNKDNSQKRN